MDFLDGFSQCDKINCMDCETTYVGRTKRQLKTRVHNHTSDVNKKSSSLSVISNHHFENHESKHLSEQIVPSSLSLSLSLSLFFFIYIFSFLIIIALSFEI